MRRGNNGQVFYNADFGEWSLDADVQLEITKIPEKDLLKVRVPGTVICLVVRSVSSKRAKPGERAQDEADEKNTVAPRIAPQEIPAQQSNENSFSGGQAFTDGDAARQQGETDHQMAAQGQAAAQQQAPASDQYLISQQESTPACRSSRPSRESVEVAQEGFWQAMHTSCVNQ